MSKTWIASAIIASALFGSFHAWAADIAVLLSEAKQARDTHNYEVAARDYQAAAEAGSSEAQALLADMYRTGGEGVDQDYAKALLWAQKAADQGNSRAQITLGILYRGGLGVPKDTAKAFEYFQTASTAGDTKAPRYVGLYYESIGDEAKAFTAYQLGAERGDITSQFHLGRAYELGAGVAQDYALAARWYGKAAERADEIGSDGMVGLASLYERGLGVPKDPTKALALYQQAASVGNETAKAAVMRLSPAG
jgi:TPR repeat protein